jgi:hypothetical protein
MGGSRGCGCFQLQDDPPVLGLLADGLRQPLSGGNDRQRVDLAVREELAPSYLARSMSPRGVAMSPRP